MKPRIETMVPHLAKLKTLKIRSELQNEIQEMADDHGYVADIWWRVSDMINKMQDDEAEYTYGAIDYKEIKKAI